MRYVRTSLCWSATSLVLMLVTGLSLPSYGQTVTGRLLDAETNSPVKGATVRLLTPEGEHVRSTQSDSLGGYSLSDLDQARYVIKARRVGYQTSGAGPFSLSSRDTLSITLTLQPSPVAMEEVTVSAEVKRRLQQVGYYDRKENTSGHFLSRTEIKNKDPSKPSELFRGVPGLKMSGQVNAGIKPYIQTVGRSTIKGGPNAASSDLLWMAGPHRPCQQR